jgi:hypothetical protein
VRLDLCELWSLLLRVQLGNILHLLGLVLLIHLHLVRWSVKSILRLLL